MFVNMTVSYLAIDPISNMPVIILKEVGGQRSLPIWIGILEAAAIAAELNGIHYSRPLTHDLLRNIFNELEIEVYRAEICDLTDNTYYAKIYLRYNDKNFILDARPSDVLAIALRTKTSVFVAENVIENASNVDLSSRIKDLHGNDKDWAKILNNLRPEDFKYKM